MASVILPEVPLRYASKGGAERLAVRLWIGQPQCRQYGPPVPRGRATPSLSSIPTLPAGCRICLVAEARALVSGAWPGASPEFRLEAHSLTPEAEAAAQFEWAEPEIGQRHRIGGEPDRDAAYPRCRLCSAPMSFYGQLDSIGDDIALADAGVVEVFVCFSCFEAAARVESR